MGEVHSKVAGSVELRNSSRSTALEHFDKALEINPDDADALEYAGMMLLELANPAGALERFNKLIGLRQQVGGFGLAKAYRLQATAYESLPKPMYGNANGALIQAVRHVPADMPLERALTHEHHAIVRQKLNTLGVSNDSYQHALTIYQNVRLTPEGKAGLERVSAAIAAINRNPTTARSSLHRLCHPLLRAAGFRPTFLREC